jgi:hypothetical protein
MPYPHVLPAPAGYALLELDYMSSQKPGLKITPILAFIIVKEGFDGEECIEAIPVTCDGECGGVYILRTPDDAYRGPWVYGDGVLNDDEALEVLLEEAASEHRRISPPPTLTPPTTPGGKVVPLRGRRKKP